MKQAIKYSASHIIAAEMLMDEIANNIKEEIDNKILEKLTNAIYRRE